MNNAAVLLDDGKSLSEINTLDFRTTLEINVLGAYQVTKSVLPLMKKQKYGRVVNVSSGYGALDAMNSGTGAYKISKLALNGMTQIMADEVSEPDIKINAMCPGWVRTDMGGPGATRSAEKATETIVWLAQMGKDGPSGLFFRDKKQIEF